MEAFTRVLTASPGEALIISKALASARRDFGRSKICVSAKGNEVRIEIESNDLSSLRASLNSKLREIKIAEGALI